MNINNVNDLYNCLRQNVAHIKFTKVDGTERVMKCTLKDDLLPEAYRGKGTVLTETTNTLRVYDLDISQWRSIRSESVLKLSIEPTSSQAQLLV